MGGAARQLLIRYSHHLNLTPIFVTINELSWIPMAMKTRMLEYKIRLNLLTYLAVGCPPLDFSRVMSYLPRDKPLVPKPIGTSLLNPPTSPYSPSPPSSSLSSSGR